MPRPGGVKRLRRFTVQVPLLKVEPLFLVGCSPDELARILQRDFKVHIDADDQRHTAGRMFTFDRTPWRVVWTRAVDLPVVLHETFHLVTRICADKGIAIRAHNEHGMNDDETAAYLFEFLARAVLRRCR